eukprot:6325912-Heterocapsa_arctica.AAC.1
MMMASIGVFGPMPLGNDWLVRALCSTMPLAVLRRTLGPLVSIALRSFLLRLTRPARWSEAPESRIH